MAITKAPFYRRAKIRKLGRAIVYPALVLASRVEDRLAKHWTQTYTVIGVISNAAIALFIFVVQPVVLPLENSNIMFLILLPILVGLGVVEYEVFMTRIHRKTLEVYDSAPCKLKLTILRIHLYRRWLTSITFALNFVLVIPAILGVSIPLLKVGIPYFLSLNVSSVLGFRLTDEKELSGVFEALPELRTLPRFHQTMTMGYLKDKIKKRLREQVALAKEISPNGFLRSLYLDYVIPNPPFSPSALQATSDLKDALTKKSDMFTVLSKPYTPSVNVPDGLKFVLPWESKFNWARWGLIGSLIPQVLAALFTLGLLKPLLALLHLG